jgi:hypothetical protein
MNSDLGEVHAGGAPDLDEVLPRDLDALEVAAHLVVGPGVPIGHEHLEAEPGLDHLVDVDGPHDALRDVGCPGRFEAVVGDGFLLRGEEGAQLVLGDDLLPHFLDQGEAGFEVHGPAPRPGHKKGRRVPLQR